MPTSIIQLISLVCFHQTPNAQPIDNLIKRYKEDENNVSEHRTNTAAEMPNGDMATHYRFVSYPNGTFKYECDSDDGWYDYTGGMTVLKHVFGQI